MTCFRCGKPSEPAFCDQCRAELEAWAHQRRMTIFGVSLVKAWAGKADANAFVLIEEEE